MWNPIETAPKDGSDILVGKRGEMPCVASWCKSSGDWELTYCGSWASDGCLDFDPDLWMHIPSY